IETAAIEIESARETEVAEWQGEFAQGEAGEAQHAGMVLTRKKAILQTSITLLYGGGGGVAGFTPFLVLVRRPIAPPDWVFGIAVGWMLGCFLFTGLWALFFLNVPASRFLMRITRRSLEGRAELAVDLGDPELLFVKIVPRSSWGKSFHETPSDIGFL